jgi:vacuolar-type H+-ATPase subunit I/STV1
MNTKTQYLATLLLCSGLLVACGTEAGKETERVNDQMKENREALAKADNAREWMNEREEARKEMADLRDNMSSRLERERQRLADGIKNAEKRAETERHIAELEQNIARIDANYVALDGASNENWENVKADTRKAADETRNWWDRQKDWIDAQTKADNDKDGK